jgi:ATP-dependent Lon protease
VRLNQPYVGIFLKKDEDNKAEVVQKLSDVYDVGSFAQIQEMQDLGDKLRVVVTAHRRVKINGQLIEELEEGEKKRKCHEIRPFRAKKLKFHLTFSHNH